MSFEINRPGDSAGEHPRLSSFGRRVVIVVLILAVVAAALIYSRVQANRRRADLADQVVAAIERSRVVCANALGAVGAGDAAQASLQVFYQRIEQAGQVTDKAVVAQEMITFCLSEVQGTSSQVDELTGARNRILLALQQYNSAR